MRKKKLKTKTISRHLLYSMLQYIKRVEETIEGEFGECRHFVQLKKHEPKNKGVILYNELLKLK